MNASVFMDELKARVAEHPFLRHPFLQLVSTQPVSRQQARTFALLYYPHILRTRLYQACALGVTPDERIQAVMTEILYDEYGNGDPSRSHMEIYRKFMRALDISEAEIANPPITPEQQGYIDTMMRVTQGTDWLAADRRGRHCRGMADPAVLPHVAQRLAHRTGAERRRAGTVYRAY